MAKSSRVWLVALLALVTLTVTACASTQPTATRRGRQGGTFRYFLGEPVAIDPLNSQESEGMEVTKQLFDGLVDYDPVTMKVVPAVAQSWKSDFANRTFTFYIRPGVRFHNGREVTAADFKWSWERVVRKGSGSDLAYHFAPISGFEQLAAGKSSGLSGVRAIDPHTLEVRLNYPYAEFPTILGHPVFSPVPREEVTRDPKAFSEAPVGNGPFRMDGPWRHGRSITVKRFEDYYGSKAFLDSVVFQIFAGDQAGYVAFKAGALDYSPVPIGQVEAAKAEYGRRALVGKAQLVVSMFGINLSDRKLGRSAAIRQAINYAIDRKAIAQVVFEGSRQPAGTLLPALLSESYEGRVYGRDIRKSRALLREAGYWPRKRLKIKLTFATGRGNEEVAQLVAEDLAQVGIDLELEGLEQGSFIEAMRRGKVQLFAFNWGADYPTPDSILYPLLYSGSQDNLAGYRSRDVDAWLLRARKSSSPFERSGLYTKAMDRALREAPLVPLTFFGSRAVYAKGVNGFLRTALDDTPLERMWLSRP